MTPTDLEARLRALEDAIDAAQDDEAFSRAVQAIERFLAETPMEAWERFAEEEEPTP